MAAYIETALVSSSGRLLIQLDDGTVIDAGYVRGGQGPAGRDGQDGAPGIPGARGEAGTNGARWITGLGAPEINEGENGDLYLDVGASFLPLYQKVNGSWLLLCNLKVPPSGGGGGSGGAAGGGGSVILYPKPDGGQPPTQDNDGKPIDKGDIWLDTNTGWLWVYDGNVWLPVGDRPPVIISPDPPNYNGASDGNIQYPVKEGDLWFDSDQLALYVAAEDEKGDLRWVITTPADRSVLQDEVDIPALPFKFPSPRTGGGNPTDGLTVYNPVTKLWYVYNDKKNQWIDLPPGVNDLSMRAILVRGADDFDETFQFNQADRDRLGTDALCYVNADDHDAFTRIVIPDVDTAGFDWSFLLRAIQSGDQLTLIQADIGDPADPDDDFPFRSDYLTVGEITENSESFNTAISFESESPVHVPLFDEEVIIRFKAIVNTGEDEIYYQEIAPDPITDPELTAGNIWIDSNDNKLYVWNGSSWSEVTACTGQDIGDFVKRSGDSMTGALVMDNASMIETVNTDIEMRRTMPNDGSGNWDVNRSRYGIIRSRCPKIIEADGTETLAQGQPFGIQIDLADRNSYRNELKVTSKTENIFRVYSGATPGIEFNDQIDRSSLTASGNDKGITKGIEIRGIPTPNKDLTPGSYAVNKEYVDQREAFLQNEIVELEEELDALAPSSERGFWSYVSSGQVSAVGGYTLYNDTEANGLGSVTTTLSNVKHIRLNERDKANVLHTFANTAIGDLLELFEQGDEDTALYQIDSIDTETITPGGGTPYTFIKMDVSFVSARPATASAGGEARFKIFKAPSGGDVSTFLNKYGDDVTATAPVNYKWSQKLTLESPPGIRLNTGNESIIVSSTKPPSYTTAIFYVEGDRNGTPKTKFRVRADGKVQAGPDAANAFIATQDHDLTTKKFVDGKIEELLARIEELEMASAPPENHIFLMQTKSSNGASSSISMSPNTIFTARERTSDWKYGQNAGQLDSYAGHLYVRFPDDTYTLNSTGTISVAKRDGSNFSTYDRDDIAFTMGISDAEKHPTENFWRASVLPKFYKRNNDGRDYMPGFYSDIYVYVLFSDGAVTKTPNP